MEKRVVNQPQERKQESMDAEPHLCLQKGVE